MMKRTLQRVLGALALALLPCMAFAGNASVSLVFAGDVVLDDAPGALIATGGDPFASFASLFKSADLCIANLECVVATTGTAADKMFGGGHNLAQAHTPLILERKGVRIALLGYNEFMPRSFEADANAPGSASWPAPWSMLARTR